MVYPHVLTHNHSEFKSRCLTKYFLSFWKKNVFEQKPSSQKMYLSGYGVELAIKSTEYKALDDTQVKSKFILYIWVKKFGGLCTSV